ncbi:hypothetical protein FDP41_008488 [Naegleria fowleri]|uniref:Uncharacterized protein n=1 Tax=Naegleria fowleri TaxID=5763 RepID=A0A6A5BFL0_NAEFO|nr:uncharacterized protein FDP41_008488 [Naegleria fowleri]KAF0973281.1 hypothetical protein FDP41_008488 [Naegleria fowleri]CAG4711378.1 unnamed protein product [Naegleria fowleri]
MKKLLKERQQPSPHTPGGTSSTSSTNSHHHQQQQQNHQHSFGVSTPVTSPFDSSFLVTSPVPSTPGVISLASASSSSNPHNNNSSSNTASVYSSIVNAHMKMEPSTPTSALSGLSHHSNSHLNYYSSAASMMHQQQQQHSMPSFSNNGSSQKPNNLYPSSLSNGISHLPPMQSNNGQLDKQSQQPAIYPSTSQHTLSDMPLPSFSIPSTVITPSSSHSSSADQLHKKFSAPNLTGSSIANVFQQPLVEPNNSASSNTQSTSKSPLPSSSAGSALVASTDSPIVEYMDDDDGWIVQWFNEDKRKKWKVKVPQFKYCKKRKEHFDKSFPDTWYKAPYKYHMHLEVANILREENVLAQIDLNYEDGQKVLSQQKTKESKKGKKKKKQDDKESGEEDKKSDEPVITNNESYFNYQSANKSTVTIGPFMYNICSYKQEGKKFRMVVYLYTINNTTPYHPFQTQPVDMSNNAVLCCCLISPSFTIRAKKPIVKPGIKSKRKRGAEDDDSKSGDEEVDYPPSPTTNNHKKMKEPTNLDSSIPVNFHPRPHENSLTQNATQAIDELLESLYQNNTAFDPSLVGASSSAASSSSSAASSSRQEINPEEKIKNITETFQSMADSERKKLLNNIIESCYPHEKEYLYRKYFENGYSDFGDSSYYQNHAQPSHMQTMLQQYQMIQQQQQDLFAYFAALNNNSATLAGSSGVQLLQSSASSSGVSSMDSSSQPQFQAVQVQPVIITNAGAAVVHNNSAVPHKATAAVVVNPSSLSFASNHQPSDVDQFFTELFD